MTSSIAALFEPYRELLSRKRQKYSYGTAGFRARYTEEMHPLFLTVGILAAFRSISLGGKCVGVMITASHNDEPDNGVKIVDVDGGMLVREWEILAEKWVNLPLEDLINEIQSHLANVPTESSEIVPLVMLGMDTRPHSPVLLEYVSRGVNAIRNGIQLCLGEVITPLLHFSVMSYNNGLVFSSPSEFSASKILSYYYECQFRGFHQLLRTKESRRTSSRKLILDSAYGVGSVTVNQFLSYVESTSQSLSVWDIEVRNCARDGVVNHCCGAEHAQKLQIPPENVSAERDDGQLLCSFDGDGDRIVFHFYSSTGEWVLLDGDRIACLFSSFIYRCLVISGLSSQVEMGIVQTAYANGSSSLYLRSLAVPVVLAKTGVKYLHHKAQQLDVGVYFEANGHGTVLFSDRFRSLLREAMKSDQDSNSSDTQKTMALQQLEAISVLINPTVGDALSDLLCTLAILEVNSSIF